MLVPSPIFWTSVNLNAIVLQLEATSLSLSFLHNPSLLQYFFLCLQHDISIKSFLNISQNLLF
jgi:hypothetical protein